MMVAFGVFISLVGLCSSGDPQFALVMLLLGPVLIVAGMRDSSGNSSGSRGSEWSSLRTDSKRAIDEATSDYLNSVRDVMGRK